MIDLHELSDKLIAAFNTAHEPDTIHLSPFNGGYDVACSGNPVGAHDERLPTVRILPIDSDWQLGAHVMVLDRCTMEIGDGPSLIVSVRGDFDERSLATIAASVLS